MPNVVAVEFYDLYEIRQIVTKLGIDPRDAVITFGSNRCEDMTEQRRTSPYLIVRDTDLERCMKIATALNEGLGVGVEIELITAFLPPKT